jgi:pyruvate/2-oxoglutarate dehydrogenase complex dihydrolipoamide dehydrogenase (E3) component
VIAVIQKHDSEERFCKLGAKVVFGTVFFKNDHTVDLDGRAITAKTWVIATGSSAAVPPIPGLKEIDYITNREIFSLDHTSRQHDRAGRRTHRHRDGPGIQPAGQRPSRWWTRPTRFWARKIPTWPRPSRRSWNPKASPSTWGPPSKMYRRPVRKKAVTLKLETVPRSTLTADAVLVAMGRSVNVEDLWLDAAGVEFDRTGITVDARLRTSQKHIFAAGDVSGGYQFTHAAGYEGGIVLSNAVFRLPRKVDYTWLPWCTYTDPELASIGLNERAAKDAGPRLFRLDRSVWGQRPLSLAEGQTVGRIKLILDKKEKAPGGPDSGPPCRRPDCRMGGRLKWRRQAFHHGFGHSSLSHPG